MANNKRIARIAGFSVITGITVLSQSGVASATGNHDSSDTKSEKVSTSSGDHVELLASKYSGGGATTIGSFNNVKGGPGSTTIGAFNNIESGGGTTIGAFNTVSDGGTYTAATSEKEHKEKKKKEDCKPTKVKVEKPKPVEVVKPIVVEKPVEVIKTVEVVKEVPAPQTQTQTQTVTVNQTVAPAPVQTIVVEKAAPVVVTQAAAPQLAHTGSETLPLAGLGAGLVALGIAMERSGKRMKRTDGASKKASKFARFVSDKNSTVVAAGGTPADEVAESASFVTANTAAWPMVVGA